MLIIINSTKYSIPTSFDTLNKREKSQEKQKKIDLYHVFCLLWAEQ